jgi:hypothetical protein
MFVRWREIEQGKEVGDEGKRKTRNGRKKGNYGF